MRIAVAAHFCTHVCAGGSAWLPPSLELCQSYIHSLCIPAMVGGRAGSRSCVPHRFLIANTPPLQHLAGKEGAELLACCVMESAGRELKLPTLLTPVTQHPGRHQREEQVLLGRVFLSHYLQFHLHGTQPFCKVQNFFLIKFKLSKESG